MPVRLTLCLGRRVRPTPAAGGFGRFLAHELESQPVDLRFTLWSVILPATPPNWSDPTRTTR
jgi:hypothetical protein